MIPTRAEVIAALQSLCNSDYGGDYQTMFAHYAVMVVTGIREVTNDGLLSLLTDANVGNWMDRDAIASEIMNELDTDHDGGISYAEFQAAQDSPTP